MLCALRRAMVALFLSKTRKRRGGLESNESVCSEGNKKGRLRPGLQRSRRLTSVRRFLQALAPVCAVTCTDAGGPVFTPITTPTSWRC